MALIANSNTIDTMFEPTASTFQVEVNGTLHLESRAVSGADWVPVGEVTGRKDVQNAVIGTQYIWRMQRTGATSFTSVRADQ